MLELSADGVFATAALPVSLSVPAPVPSAPVAVPPAVALKKSCCSRPLLPLPQKLLKQLVELTEEEKERKKSEDEEDKTTPSKSLSIYMNTHKSL